MKKILSILILTAIAIVAITCKKTPEIPTSSNKIEIGETTIDSIAYFTANVNTAITATGGNEITQHGHCWSTEQEPTIVDNKTTLGKLTKPDTVFSQLTGLENNTLYYLRSYITYKNGTLYSTEENLKTLEIRKPIVSTNDVTNITINSATCGGANDDGGLNVTEHGACWNTWNNPTLENNIGHTSDGYGTGSFTSNITGLNEGVTHYVTAYATNEKGTSYGEVKQFTTAPITLPMVTTNEITNITVSSATSGGNVTSNGNGTVTARGVCWNTTGSPTLENNIGITNDGNSTGSFTSYITDLSEGVTYYLTAYATNEKGTSYGEVKQFTTVPITLPTVSTNDIANITISAATSGGNVTSNGNDTVTARGVCYNTTGNPTLQNSLGHTIDGSGIGSFTSEITDLNIGVTYYVTAYATNEKGTSYGNVKVFITLELMFPEVETILPTNITASSAQGGGNVTSDGNGTVISRGVCWNITNTPTLQNNIGSTEDGEGIGVYSSFISGLDDFTNYYFAAYATNEKGTVYGSVEHFKTVYLCGESVIEYGGQTYHSVQIGNQCWFVENLNIGLRINGDQDQYDNAVIEKYCYDNDNDNCDEYGGLYQWNEMMQYTIQEGAQGICPDGWHIPTDEEWKILEGTTDSQYGVGDPIWNETDWRGYDAGKKLKSTAGWYNNGNGINYYGYNVKPGGFRSPQSGGIFANITISGQFFTSSTANSLNIWVRAFSSGYDNLLRAETEGKLYGESVRCLKD